MLMRSLPMANVCRVKFYWKYPKLCQRSFNMTSTKLSRAIISGASALFFITNIANASTLGEPSANNFWELRGSVIDVSQDGSLSIEVLASSQGESLAHTIKQRNVLGFAEQTQEFLLGKEVNCLPLIALAEITYADCFIKPDPTSNTEQISLISLVEQDSPELLGCSMPEREAFQAHGVVQCR